MAADPPEVSIDRRPRCQPTADADADARRMRALSLSVAVVVSLGIAWPGPAAAAPIEPVVTIHGGDPEQRARLDDALARFEAAGLRLADFTIVFSDDESVCVGHVGVFRHRDETPQVSVCSELEFVVLHELAHVWLDGNLEQDARDEYVRARGLTTWSDHTVPWTQRGVEDAAFIIQQNLRDVAPRVLASAAWAERIAAFELVTGTPSPLRARSPGLATAAAIGAQEPPMPCLRLFGPLWHITSVLTRCRPP